MGNVFCFLKVTLNQNNELNYRHIITSLSWYGMMRGSASDDSISARCKNIYSQQKWSKCLLCTHGKNTDAVSYKYKKAKLNWANKIMSTIPTVDKGFYYDTSFYCYNTSFQGKYSIYMLPHPIPQGRRGRQIKSQSWLYWVRGGVMCLPVCCVLCEIVVQLEEVKRMQIVFITANHYVFWWPLVPISLS